MRARDLEKLTGLTRDDYLIALNDPAGTPAGKAAEWGLVSGTLGQARLKANTNAGATSCSLNALPKGAAAGAGWLLFDPYTTECELRKWTGGTATVPTFTALTYAHSADDPILFLHDATVYAKWFGAKGDGTTDDTTALQRAIDASTDEVSTAYGHTLILSPGVYKITGTLSVSQSLGMIIRGTGKDSIIKWYGNSSDPALLVVDSQQCTFSDFWIQANSSLAMGIQIKNTASSYAARLNMFYRIVIGETNVVDGFYIGGGLDANNDYMIFSQCKVTSSRYNWYIGGAQSYGTLFRDCWALTGQYGVYSLFGYVTWFGGSMYAHTEADFYQGAGSAQPWLISGVVSETSKRFVWCSSWYSPTITIEHCSWAADNINSDGRFLYFNGPQPIRIVNNYFGKAMAGGAIELEIDWDTAANDRFPGASLEFVGNTIVTVTVPTSRTLADLFSTHLPTFASDNCFVQESNIYSQPISGTLIRPASPTAGTSGKEALEIQITSTIQAAPVLKLVQADVSEEAIRVVGSAASGVLTQTLVDNGDVTTPTLVGWLKIYIQDDGNQITDQAYYVPFYTLA